MYPATAWVGGTCDVLVGPTTADDDIRGPVVGAGQRQKNAAASVGVRPVVSRQICELLDSGVGTNVEDLAGLGYEDEKSAVVQEMDEWIHVVRLIHRQYIHGYADAVGNTLIVQDLVCRIIIGLHSRIEAVQATRSHEDCPVRHGLRRRVPSRAGQFVAGLTPRLAIKTGISRGTRKISDCSETIANCGVDKVQGRVTTEGKPTSVGQEGPPGAKCVCLQLRQLLLNERN